MNEFVLTAVNVPRVFPTKASELGILKTGVNVVTLIPPAGAAAKLTLTAPTGVVATDWPEASPADATPKARAATMTSGMLGEGRTFIT